MAKLSDAQLAKTRKEIQIRAARMQADAKAMADGRARLLAHKATLRSEKEAEIKATEAVYADQVAAIDECLEDPACIATAVAAQDVCREKKAEKKAAAEEKPAEKKAPAKPAKKTAAKKTAKKPARAKRRAKKS